MGSKKSKFENDEEEICDILQQLIRETLFWDQEIFQQLQANYLPCGDETKCDDSSTSPAEAERTEYLQKTQFNVNVAKTVGASKAIAGSTLGIVGGALLFFPPTMPAGAIVALTGLGLGLSGGAVEGGSEMFNFFAGKKAFVHFKEGCEKANINLDNYCKILERIDYLTTKFVADKEKEEKEEQKRTKKSSVANCRPICVPDHQTHPEEKKGKEINAEDGYDVVSDDESEEGVDMSPKDARFFEILHFLAILWVYWELENENKPLARRHRPSLDVAKSLSTSTNVKDATQSWAVDIGLDETLPLAFSTNSIKQLWSAVQQGVSLGSFGSDIRSIVQHSIFLAGRSASLLGDSAADAAAAGAGAGATAARLSAPSLLSNLDEVGSASTCTGLALGTTAKVFNGLSIAGGVVGIAFAGYSLHQTVKSLKSGSQSPTKTKILTLISNIHLAFMIKSLVEADVAKIREEREKGKLEEWMNELLSGSY